MSVAPVVTETTYVLEAGNLGPFATVWPYADAGDVDAWLDAADGAGPQLLAAPAQYTVASSSPLVNGGTVTLNGALLPSGGWSVGATLSLARTTSNGQPSVFGEDLGFSPAACEAALDNVERQVQELQSAADRAVSVPFGESAGMLPPADERAGMFLGFDAAGNPIMLPNGGDADTALRQDLADPAAGARLVAFQQSNSAVVRTVMNKLRERVSVMDDGAACDGITDDTIAWRTCLARFTANGTGIASGSIYMPGPSKISAPLIYAGHSEYALRIHGDAGRSGNPALGSGFIWAGAAGGAMLIANGAANFQLERINFAVGAGTGLVAAVHLTCDQTYTDALTANQLAGANVTAHVTTNAKLMVGASMGVGKGTPNYEVVYIKSLPGGGNSFVADFVKSHAVGDLVGGSSETESCSVVGGAFGVPTGAASAGVLAGNLLTQTPQISEIEVKGSVFRCASGVDGDGYAGFKLEGGGNAKDFTLDGNKFFGLQHAISIEGDADQVKVHDSQFQDSVVVDVWVHGVIALEMTSNESESAHNPRMLDGSEGVNFPHTAVLSGNVYESTPPADGYVIKHGGSLVLLGNRLGGPTGAPILTKIRCGNVNGVTAGVNPSSIVSLGNYMGTAGPGSTIFFDSSDNAMDFGDFGVTLAGQRIFSAGDHGDGGALPHRIGGLSGVGAALSIQTPAPGATYSKLGQAATGRNQVVVPFAAWSAAALTKDLLLFSVPPKTKIVAAWADTNPKFAGPGGTLLLRVGLTSGGAELLLDHNVSTAAVVKPALDADLGASINRAGAVLGGALLPTGGAVFARLTSSSGNLSGLNAGSVTITVVTERA